MEISINFPSFLLTFIPPFHTVCGSEDLLGTDQTAATERSGAGAGVKEAHLPGVLIGLSLLPTHYPAPCGLTTVACVRYTV